MASTSAFLQFWWTDATRTNFLSCMPKEDLPSFRLACHDFGLRSAPFLFDELSVTFRASTFTKPARMAALDRIGPLVKRLKFHMPHGPETFLPPLLDAVTGEQVEFIYEPYCQPAKASASRLSVPMYGTWEVTDLLVKQYPPLFHSAANTPSFIHAFGALRNLEELAISCPGQEPINRFRRNVVDYALISLRIALERNSLPVLDSLVLAPIHPSGILYLNPTMGFGARPNSVRRWQQIKKLNIQMDSLIDGDKHHVDHLKLLHAYLHVFTKSLTRFHFCWLGRKGPFPLQLGSEPALSRPSPPQACPKRCRLALPPLKIRNLLFMEIENASLDAQQVSSFITLHRKSISEFNFEHSVLRTGTWDEALAPLTHMSGNDDWKRKAEESMDVPLVLRPCGMAAGPMEKVMLQCRKDYLRRVRAEKAGWSKGGWKGRSLLSSTEEHLKRMLKNSVFTWR